MKKLYTIFLAFILMFGIVACTDDNTGENTLEETTTMSLNAEQQLLYDELEGYELTAEEGLDLVIFGSLRFYYRDHYNNQVHISSYDNSVASGYIDCQDNYGFFYIDRFDSYKGEVIEGRENQLLKTFFIDDEADIIELESENTRSNFEQQVKMYGYTFPNYGSYSVDLNNKTLITTTLSEIMSNDNGFIYDTLRLTEEEINNNLDAEATISFDFSEENRFEFVLEINEFYIEGRYDEHVELEYELTFLIREALYDDAYRILPAYSFPSDYQNCDIAYEAGNYIKMNINRNSNTYVKLELEEGIHSIHLAKNGVMFTGINLYNEEMTLINKDDKYYNIEEAGIYYVEIENNTNEKTVGNLYIDKGEINDFTYAYGGPISTMYPDEIREVTLINYTPEDGYIYFFGSSSFVLEIVYNDISYFTERDVPLFVPVVEGEQVTITVISITENGTGFINWRFVLEEVALY